jgi:hypothetical protein
LVGVRVGVRVRVPSFLWLQGLRVRIAGGVMVTIRARVRRVRVRARVRRLRVRVMVRVMLKIKD